MSKSKVDSKLVEEVKDILLEKKEKLEKELGQFARTNVHNSEDFQTNFPDYGEKDDENSAEVAVFSDNLSLEHSLEKSLRDVKKALKLIEDGEYGLCKYCKQTIDPNRLKARPASTSCMTCKTRLKGR